MSDWYDQHRDWRGAMTDFLALVHPLLDESDPAPNERLIRNYVQLDILERPVRQGKEAYFGIRQAVEFVVARRLLREGWPLAKIAEFNRTHELDALLELLPEARPKTAAEQLALRYRAQTSTAGCSVAEKSPTPFLQHSANWARRTINSRDALKALGNSSGEPQRSTVLKLTLTPWCELLIDRERLSQVAPDDLESLVDTLTHVLHSELRTARRNLK